MPILYRLCPLYPDGTNLPISQLGAPLSVTSGKRGGQKEGFVAVIWLIKSDDNDLQVIWSKLILKWLEVCSTRKHWVVCQELTPVRKRTAWKIAVLICSVNYLVYLWIFFSCFSLETLWFIKLTEAPSMCCHMNLPSVLRGTATLC